MEKLEVSGKTFKMLWTLLLYSVEKGGELFKVLRTVYPYGLSKILADQAKKWQFDWRKFPFFTQNLVSADQMYKKLVVNSLDRPVAVCLFIRLE